MRLFMKIRALSSLLLLFAFAACDGEPTGPGTDPAPTGTFALETYEGHAVPHAYTLAGCTGPSDVYDEANTLEAEVFDGSFAFDPIEGTYSMQTRIRARCVTPTGEATLWQAGRLTHEGAYEGGPDTFHLWDDRTTASADWSYEAALADGTLTVLDANGAQQATFTE